MTERKELTAVAPPRQRYLPRPTPARYAVQRVEDTYRVESAFGVNGIDNGGEITPSRADRQVHRIEALDHHEGGEGKLSKYFASHALSCLLCRV